jgi:hypothetical protein
MKGGITEMIKGNEHILIEFKTFKEDLNELKLMTFGDNLCKIWHTDMSILNGDEVIITLIYDDIDVHMFKGEKVNEGWLITNDKRISLRSWE